jgi:hypothetical protein
MPVKTSVPAQARPAAIKKTTPIRVLMVQE